jgi:hypothetical protein
MDQKLKDLIVGKKSVILERWFDAIIETYPSDATGFLKKQKDRFANPIGHTISQGTEGILEVLIGGKELTEDLPFLNNFIKVRAIQDFTPSKAMTFIFLIKKVIRETLEKEIRQNQIYDALLRFETKIDDLALFAFDIYVKCREQIYELKTDELKRMTYTLLKKANLMYEIPTQELEVKVPECNPECNR